jgi:hypothetical protein
MRNGKWKMENGKSALLLSCFPGLYAFTRCAGQVDLVTSPSSKHFVARLD